MNRFLGSSFRYCVAMACFVATDVQLYAADLPLESSTTSAAEPRSAGTYEPRVETVTGCLSETGDSVLLTRREMVMDYSAPDGPRRKLFIYPSLLVDAATTVQTAGGERIELSKLAELVKEPRRVLIATDLDPYFLDLYKPETIVIVPAKPKYGTPPGVIMSPPGYTPTAHPFPPLVYGPTNPYTPPTSTPTALPPAPPGYAPNPNPVAPPVNGPNNPYAPPTIIVPQR